jgi:hypothetical protein
MSQVVKAEPDTLHLERVKFEREKLEFEKRKSSNLATAISIVAILISVSQVMVAYSQSKVAKAQTVEKFFPHLQNPNTRTAALSTMASFLDDELVTDVAKAVKATDYLGLNSSKRLAADALRDLESKRTGLIASIYSSDQQVRIKATVELARDWPNDASLVPQILETARKGLDNVKGTCNALVILHEVPVDTLRFYALELVPFLQDAAAVDNPDTKLLATQVWEKAGFPGKPVPAANH